MPRLSSSPFARSYDPMSEIKLCIENQVVERHLVENDHGSVASVVEVSRGAPFLPPALPYPLLDVWREVLQWVGVFFGGGGSATPCASPPPWPPHFYDHSFWVHHLVNWDDHQLLAHAMASDFSIAWQCLSKRTIGSFNELLPLTSIFNPIPLSQKEFSNQAHIKTLVWKRVTSARIKFSIYVLGCHAYKQTFLCRQINSAQVVTYKSLT
jgi:hypothetical protein